jgi:hypothetical protein
MRTCFPAHSRARLLPRVELDDMEKDALGDANAQYVIGPSATFKPRTSAQVFLRDARVIAERHFSCSGLNHT